jgi:hypothetical protein
MEVIMPINYPQFKPLNASEIGGLGGIDLAGSIRSGLQNANSIQEARYKPQNLQQELYAKQLANTINEAKAKYAPQQEEANVNNKLASTDYYKALSQQALRPKPIGGKISQLEQLRDRFPKGSQQYILYDTALQNALSGQQGITVYDPQGNPMVQIGGSSGSKGSKGGQLYQNKEGDQYISPTGAVQTNLQQRIIGQKIVEPYIQNMIKTLPQFQSGWTQGLSNAEGIANRWLGTNFDLPSQLQEGKASRGVAAEGMLKEFGLNATGRNLVRMEEILTPGKDESVEGYKERALRQAVQFMKTAQEVQKISRSGVPVKQGNNPNITIDRLNGESEKANNNKKASKNEPIDLSQYDIPAGSILLYKNGKPRVFPAELVDQKLREGYNYE